MEHILIIRGGEKGVEEKDIALHSIRFDSIRRSLHKIPLHIM